jgi:hypothetical protein
MNLARSLALHIALLVVAVAFAAGVWSKDEKPKAAKSEQVEVWGGRPDELTSIAFETDKLRVQLEPRKDSKGRFYATTVDKSVEKPITPPGSDGGLPAPFKADAGPPKTESKRESQRFVSVKEADKLAESLAPMMALRQLGKVDDARAEEFGFDKPEGTLRVAFGSRQHSLVLGGTTPGGGDRYAKDPQTGNVFAISGDLGRNLQFAESRLIERELHDFKPEDVKRVKITKGTATRELVRMEEKKDGWADPATPDKLDETAGNWMSKLGRLRAQQFIESIDVPVLPEYQIVRVEYFDGKKSLGALDLIRIPDDKSNAGFLVQTEYTRWYAQVLKSSAEQVQQDLGSVIK